MNSPVAEPDFKTPLNLEIGNEAFYSNPAITSVVLGNGVKSIGDYSFAYCNNLKTFEASESLEKIGKCAFYVDSNGLTKLTLPKNGKLCQIGDSAFIGLRIKGELDLPDAVRHIGDAAFLNARAVTKVILPNNQNLTLGNRAFAYGQRIAEVEQPSVFVAIGDSCFMNSIIPDITVNAAKVGKYAFAESGNLTKVSLSDNVKEIGANCFESSPKLSEINFGLGIEKLGDYALKGTAVDSISFSSAPEANPVIEIGAAITDNKLRHLSLGNRVKSLNGSTFSFEGNNTEEYDETSVFDLGSSVETIADNSISVLYKSSLTLPPSLKEYGYNNITVDTLNVPISPETLKFKGGGFSTNKLFYVNRNIDYGSPLFLNSKYVVFGDNKDANIILDDIFGTDKVVFGASVSHIKRFSADYAFFEDGVQIIDEFRFMKPQQSLTLPGSLKKIGRIYFWREKDNNVVELIFRDSEDPLEIGSESIDISKVVTLYLGRSLTPSSTFTFKGHELLGSVIIGNKVTSISNNMFQGCVNLAVAIMGDKVEHIGDYAFDGCSGLDILSIGESTKTIGTNAYQNCNNFSRIVARGLVPPTGNVGFGTEVEENVLLIVPDEVKDEYLDSDLFWLFSNVDTFTGSKLVKEIKTEGTIDKELTFEEILSLPHTLVFIFELYNYIFGHYAPAHAVARAEEAVTPAIHWFSPNPEIASVDQDGMMTVHQRGNFEIWAYAMDGSDKKAVISIENEEFVKGDANGDNVVDGLDLNQLIRYINGKGNHSIKLKVNDLNNDGIIDQQDIDALVDTILAQ